MGPRDDEIGAKHDQIYADRDQLASDDDQAASNHEHFNGIDESTPEASREAREHTTRERQETARERDAVAVRRDTTGRERDLAALEADRAAEQRDCEARERGTLSARLANGGGGARARSGVEVILRAARDRQRAAEDRAWGNEERALAAQDRERAARDRLAAARDRAAAVAEREIAETDDLTGVLRRGPGRAALQRELDRARRTDAPLVAAFVDVDGLKIVNDTEGHGPGDTLLQSVAAALRSNMRDYDLIIRVGGDEFICILAGASLEDARERFGAVQQTLAHESGASITIGYAELAAHDTATALIDRADSDLLATRAHAGDTTKSPTGNR